MGARVDVAGQSLALLDRAAYWQAERALLVSDLHLGKAETFQGAGLGIPSGHAEADLARLSALQQSTGAERLFVLGDLVHARRGITPGLVDRVGAWLGSFPAQIHIVGGNHDRHVDLSEVWGLESSAELERSGLLLVHAPQPADVPQICGHLHPVVRLRSGPDDLRLPCFVLESSRLVLPAFGSFTGGMPVERGGGRRIFAVADGTVVPL